MLKRTSQEARERMLERRQREDQAPRLIREARRVTSLDIAVDNAGNRYVWRIVVERAPALFELRCPEPSCTNGGHDITRAIMHGLRNLSTRFEGESVCDGDVPAGRCGRSVKFVATATYSDAKLVA